MGLAAMATQFRILMGKNALLGVRNFKGTVTQLATPIVVCLILWLFQLLSDAVLSRSTEFPVPQDVPKLARCPESREGNCTTLLYAPVSVEWVISVMSVLAAQNGLDMGHDVAALNNGTTNLDGTWCIDNSSAPFSAEDYIDPTQHIPNFDFVSQLYTHGHTAFPCAFFRDNETLIEFLLANPASVQNAVMFPSAYLNLSFPGLPEGANLSFGYQLYFNGTISKFPFNGNDHSIEAMLALDRSLLTVRRPSDVVDIQATWRSFPTPKPRLAGFDVVGSNGGIWFYIPGMAVFFILLVEIVTEKERRLRYGMQMMGLRDSVFWSSWFLTGVAYGAGSTLILCVSGVAFRFDLFTNCDFAVLLVLFFLFSLAMVSVALCLAAVIGHAKAAQTAGYTIILVGFVFQTILCSAYGSLIDLLFSPSLPAWVIIVRVVLMCYPPFNLAKAYYVSVSPDHRMRLMPRRGYFDACAGHLCARCRSV